MAARTFIARHGETVHNAAARLQGDALHTPLTRAGFAQAEAIGDALLQRLGARPNLALWASPTGRALQTLAIVAEQAGLDWHGARTDARLAEIDMGGWGGRYYAEVIAEAGPIIDPVSLLFAQRGPGGEWYDGVAMRLQDWLDDTAEEARDRVVIMHGISSRVLRGMMTATPVRPECGAPVADHLPQGSLVEIEAGMETIVHRGGGEAAV